MENKPAGSDVRVEGRFDFVHEFLKRALLEDACAKRVLSLADATLGVMTAASLAVSLIGQALAQARGLLAKSEIEQVDRLLSNTGVVVWDLFAAWVRGAVKVERHLMQGHRVKKFVTDG